MAFKYTIKPLSAEYEAFMWELLYDNIFVERESGEADREMEDLPMLKAYIKEWGSREDDIGFVALDQNNQPVGAVWTRLFDSSDEAWGFISNDVPELNIATIKTVRGCGVGTALLDAMMRRLEGKYPAVSLSVHPENRCISLYRRFGFTVYEEYDNALTMRRPIEGAEQSESA